MTVSDKKIIPQHQSKRFLSNPGKYWNIFYKNNKTNFFKDRHWTTREFPQITELFEKSKVSKQCILEVGCGVGNFIYPLFDLIQSDMNLMFYACDYSSNAIELVKSNELYKMQPCNAFVADISLLDAFSDYVDPLSVNLCSMIFVLSALHPSTFKAAIQNIYSVVTDDGYVIFRDYAVGDHAQQRFEQSSDPKCLEHNLYLRQDGTMSFFFDMEQVKQLFENAGFQTISVELIRNKTVNKKQNLDADRLFIQAVFKKCPIIKSDV